MSPDVIISHLGPYTYVFLYLGAIIEGPIIMTTSGLLLRLEYLSLVPLYLALMAGDLTADVGWYVVGRFAGRGFVEKYGRFFGLSETVLAKTEMAFHRHHTKILLLSKISMGFGFSLMILITAGITHIPFRKYIALNLIGQSIWTALLLSIGYFFGNVYLSVNKGLRYASVIAFIALIFALSQGIIRYQRSKDLKNIA